MTDARPWNWPTSEEVDAALIELGAATYGAGQPAFNKQLKQSLDPNGMIFPAKSGIFN